MSHLLLLHMCPADLHGAITVVPHFPSFEILKVMYKDQNEKVYVSIFRNVLRKSPKHEC